jgi:hypothetical protein
MYVPVETEDIIFAFILPSQRHINSKLNIEKKPKSTADGRGEMR